MKVTSIHINEDDAFREIELEPEEIVEVHLEGLGTMGYLWNVAFDSDYVNVSKNESRSEASRFGAHVNTIFKVKSRKPGTTVVSFTLARPWEKGTIRTHAIRFKVKS